MMPIRRVAYPPEVNECLRINKQGIPVTALPAAVMIRILKSEEFKFKIDKNSSLNLVNTANVVPR